MDGLVEGETEELCVWPQEPCCLSNALEKDPRKESSELGLVKVLCSCLLRIEGEQKESSIPALVVMPGLIKGEETESLIPALVENPCISLAKHPLEGETGS